MPPPERPGVTFVTAFTDWVEACWFDERDRATSRLESLLELPPDVVLAGSLALLGRLLEHFAPVALPDVASALAAHLILTGPDPGREAVIRDTVAAAADGRARASALLRHGTGAVTIAALECASLLAQTLADREGVVPSSILRGW